VLAGQALVLEVPLEPAVRAHVSVPASQLLPVFLLVFLLECHCIGRSPRASIQLVPSSASTPTVVAVVAVAQVEACRFSN
jgi:hypothetical protein